MSTTTVTSKGQITIPVEIRRRLDLKTGDKIDFIIDDTNHVSFSPVTQNITTLKGLVAKPERSVSIDQMKATIKAASVERTLFIAGHPFCGGNDALSA